MTYINPRAKVFAHLDRVQAWNSGRRAAPVTVEWDLSNRCVLGCQDCHFAHTHSRGPWVTKDRLLPMAFESTGDLAELSLVKRALSDMGQAGVKAVVWSGGGEPTTHPDYFSVLLYARSRGLRQGMYTLGGLLTEQTADAISDLLDWVVVSLDCPDAETYAAEKGVPAERFETACQGVRWLSTAGKLPSTTKWNDRRAVVGVSFLLHSGNWWRADEMRDLARSLGADYVTFRPTIQTKVDAPSLRSHSTNWVTDALPTLRWLAEDPFVEVDAERFQQYRDWRGHGYTLCRGVRLNTTITPDGRVWLCPQRRGVGGSCLGDLRTEDFSSLWSRHPGHYLVDEGCRVMCRLHPVNQQLEAMSATHAHEAFV